MLSHPRYLEVISSSGKIFLPLACLGCVRRCKATLKSFDLFGGKPALRALVALEKGWVLRSRVLG